MPSYKVIYFNGRGRAELIRILLSYGGEKFEDVRLSLQQRDAWNQMKPNTPFGMVPILEVDGKQLGQSHAIERYLARKFGLAASGEWEQALVESVADTCEDIFQQVSRVFREADESKKADEAKQLKEKTIPETFNYLEKFISQNGSDVYVVGNKMTLADIALANIIDQLAVMKHFPLVDLQKWPHIKKVYDAVHSHSKLVEYFTNRPDSQF